MRANSNTIPAMTARMMNAAMAVKARKIKSPLPNSFLSLPPSFKKEEGREPETPVPGKGMKWTLEVSLDQGQTGLPPDFT
jgi:hypothetical protein